MKYAACLIVKNTPKVANTIRITLFAKVQISLSIGFTEGAIDSLFYSLINGISK